MFVCVFLSACVCLVARMCVCVGLCNFMMISVRAPVHIDVTVFEIKPASQLLQSGCYYQLYASVRFTVRCPCMSVRIFFLNVSKLN